jgi:hypothetical protein
MGSLALLFLLKRNPPFDANMCIVYNRPKNRGRRWQTLQGQGAGTGGGPPGLPPLEHPVNISSACQPPPPPPPTQPPTPTPTQPPSPPPFHPFTRLIKVDF